MPHLGNLGKYDGAPIHSSLRDHLVRRFDRDGALGLYLSLFEEWDDEVYQECCLAYLPLVSIVLTQDIFGVTPNQAPDLIMAGIEKIFYVIRHKGKPRDPVSYLCTSIKWAMISELNALNNIDGDADYCESVGPVRLPSHWDVEVKLLMEQLPSHLYGRARRRNRFDGDMKRKINKALRRLILEVFHGRPANLGRLRTFIADYATILLRMELLAIRDEEGPIMAGGQLKWILGELEPSELEYWGSFLIDGEYQIGSCLT